MEELKSIYEITGNIQVLPNGQSSRHVLQEDLCYLCVFDYCSKNNSKNRDRPDLYDKENEVA